MKKGTKKMWMVLAACLGAAAVAAAVYLSGTPKDGKPADSAAAPSGQAEEKKPVNVVVQAAVPETVDETFTLPGTLDAWENLTLSLEQTGTILWIGPREGDSVRAGEEILRIDTKALQTQHEKNQADYNLKEKQLRRVEALLKDKLVSQREFDEVRNAFDSANSNLQQISIALEKSILRSPIDGILDRLLVDRGEYGNEGTPAAVVVQVDRLKVLVDVPEKDVRATKVGQKVTVMAADVEGERGPIREGSVIHVGYEADERTRTYPAKVEIDNRSRLLRPGMIVRVHITRNVLHEVLVVPLYAVLDREGEKSVFVEDNGTAVRKLVRLGPVIDGRVVVYGGLQPGDRLVVKGQQLLADGGPVAVIEE